MGLDPEIWGTHFWFFLHTIAITYSLHPNDVIKKKYYDFIQNIPIFIPNKEIGNKFIDLLDKFPVTPYLDSRLSFMKWVHFIHNKINEEIGKPKEDFYDSLEKYYKQYEPENIKKEKEKKDNNMYYIGFIGVIILLIIYNIK